MSNIEPPQDPEKSFITKVLREQAEVFYTQYDMEKYNQADEEGRERFIIELKYWIKKFEVAEELKTAHLSLKNKLIRFTEAEVFQHEMQLEMVKMLLPFLRAQLRVAELEKAREEIPKVRKEAILPLGGMTLGELRLNVTEQVPEFAGLNREEQVEIINEAIQEVVELYKKAGGTAYIMDTKTLAAQLAQQLNENQQNYQRLQKLSHETLTAIENAPSDLPHTERVKLQQRSVKIQLQLAEFEKWFMENKVPLPSTELIHKPQSVSNTEGQTQKGKSLTVWTGNKSEFCRFVQTEYENHKDQYTSLRDATFKLFPQYSFSDKKWSAYDCYELVKKV